jgi:hypothetical protein
MESGREGEGARRVPGGRGAMRIVRPANPGLRTA